MTHYHSLSKTDLIDFIFNILYTRINISKSRDMYQNCVGLFSSNIEIDIVSFPRDFMFLQ